MAGENPDAAGAAAVHRAAENFVGPAGVGRAGKRVAGRGAEEGERGLRVRILLGIDIQSYSKRAEITPPSMFTMYFVVVSARHLFALP